MANEWTPPTSCQGSCQQGRRPCDCVPDVEQREYENSVERLSRLLFVLALCLGCWGFFVLAWGLSNYYLGN